MTQDGKLMHQLLSRFDFRKPVHQNLAILQKILQSEDISATSRFGLQAYELICQEYINISQKKGTISKQKTQVIQKFKPQDSRTTIKVDTVLLTQRQSLLNKILKQKYFKVFKRLLRQQKEVNKNQQKRMKNLLRQQTAKFHYRIKTCKKVIKILKDYCSSCKINQQKLIEYLRIKNEIKMQEYFLAWKEQAFMTQAQRQYRKQIQQKYAVLSKITFFRKLQIFKANNTECKKSLVNQQQQFLIRLMSLKVGYFYKRLKNILQDRMQNIQIVQQSLIVRKKNYLQQFKKTINKIRIYRNIRQQQRVTKCSRFIYGWSFITILKSEYQLRKAYFKDHNKIILVGMIIEGAAQSLRRKGYQYQWMSNVDKSLKYIDSKLNNTFHKFKLHKIFNGIKSYLNKQRQKINEIKLMRNGYFLKQMIYNFKLSIIKQKQSHKLQSLSIYLKHNARHQIIHSIQIFKNHHNKITLLQSFLLQQRIRNALMNIKQYYRSSKYYASKLTTFIDRRHHNHLLLIFDAMKTVLFTQKVNNRIVQQYRRYINHQKASQIFQCLKDYTFSQQLIKKREKNIVKIRLREYCDNFFYNLKIQLYSKMKSKYRSLKISQAKVIRLRQQNAFKFIYHRYRSKKDRIIINQRINKQYSLRFQWKIFNLLKVITLRKKDETKKSRQIQQNISRKIKQKTMDRFITVFINFLVLKKLNQFLDKKLLSNSFTKILEFDSSKQQILRNRSVSDESWSGQVGIQANLQQQY